MRQFPIKLFLLGISLLVLHVVFIRFHFYWMFLWLDIPMHLLASFVVGYLFLFFLSGRYAVQKVFSKTILFVLFVGFLWEVFELSAGFSELEVPGFAFDTALDLLCDIFGAVGSYFYFKLDRKND